MSVSTGNLLLKYMTPPSPPQYMTSSEASTCVRRLVHMLSRSGSAVLLWAKQKTKNMHVYTHAYISLHVYTHVYTHVYIHVYTHAYIHVYTHAYIHVYTPVYKHTRLHACLYTRLHTCLHTHVYIHVYTHMSIHTSQQKPACTFGRRLRFPKPALSKKAPVFVAVLLIPARCGNFTRSS